MKIKQARFSSWIWHFRDNFLKRWGLDHYHDTKAPCYFAGVYTVEDVQAINNHKGLKVVWFTGADVKNHVYLRDENIVVKWTKSLSRKDHGFRTKQVYIELKDYGIFKPNVLGDRVYCYVRKPTKYDFFNKHIADQVQEVIPFKIIFGEWGVVDPVTIYRVKRKYYDKCFVNLRLNPYAGGTTAIELAHMGRKTISKRSEGFYLNYETIEDIARHIMSESNKIGTIQPDQTEGFYNASDEWLDVDFWK